MTAPGPWGVYVHVPWCRRRCPYCAFYVEVDRDVDWERFVDRVLSEYDVRRREFATPPATVFLGGGTPSRMPAGPLARLIEGLGAAPGAEVSAECNPEDADEGWLDGALAAGVTRVSLGMQTFDPKFARLLNRACTVDVARRIASTVGASGVATWSVDLIFALPGQTLADLDAEIDAVFEVDAPHVALYGLTFEEGTPFERARRQGKLRPTPDARWRAMYDRLVDRLEASGRRRYEVSNFARPGHESRHNLLYWTDAPYLGLGPSAHGYLPDGRRYHNVRDVTRYLDDADPTAEIEAVVGADRAADLLVSGLRGVGGVDLDRLRARTGHEPSASAIARLVAGGVLAHDGRHLRLTPSGFPVSDAVVRELVTSLGPTAGSGVGPASLTADR